MTDKAIHEPAYRKRVGYQGALLGGFATLAATLLVMGNLSTFDTIQLRIAEDLQASLGQVVPDSVHDNNLLDNRVSIQDQGNEIVVYQAIRKGTVTAVAYNISGQGYAGEISLIMGVNSKGEILGVRVLSHAETPGLGDRIEAEKDDWIYKFDGLSFEKLAREHWKVKKDGGDFDQFSGATITPRGVVKAIKQGLEMFNLHRDQFLAVRKREPPKVVPPDVTPKTKQAAPDTGQAGDEQ